MTSISFLFVCGAEFTSALTNETWLVADHKLTVIPSKMSGLIEALEWQQQHGAKAKVAVANVKDKDLTPEEVAERQRVKEEKAKLAKEKSEKRAAMKKLKYDRKF